MVLLELLGLSGKKSFMERLADRLIEAVEQAAGSVERTRGRAAELAEGTSRRTGTRLREARERARSGALSGRDALSERVEAIQRRTAELRERRERRREVRHRARAERGRQRRRSRQPMQLNVRRDDRLVLRGRQPIDVRMSDGGLIRYRFYERPSFWLRSYLRLTGRQIWPRR